MKIHSVSLTSFSLKRSQYARPVTPFVSHHVGRGDSGTSPNSLEVTRSRSLPTPTLEYGREDKREVTRVENRRVMVKLLLEEQG